MQEIAWECGINVYGVGSSVVEERLQWSLGILRDRFDVRVPPAGRHVTALRLLKNLHEANKPVSLEDDKLLRRLEAANRTAVETYLLTLGAMRARKKRNTPFQHRSLQALMGGAELSDGARSIARDTQFELYTAAILQLGGADVLAGEPDLRFYYGQEVVGVAAKRISSAMPSQVQKNVKKAVSQIHATERRGWIALNLDARFASIEPREPEDDLLEDFASTFNSVNSALERYKEDPLVLGVMVFGHLVWWTKIAEDIPPTLRSVSPFRWVGWIENAGELLFNRDFLAGWKSRFASRAPLAWSPDYQDLLSIL